MFEQMNSLVDEVRQIEGKVVEISQLQKVFTEKVLEQVIQINNNYTETWGVPVINGS